MRGFGGRTRRRALAAAVAALAGMPAAAPAAPSSLPEVASGERPGPAVLYAPRPRAPQLENTGVWKARPILVSGASAYRRGEFLYQDFVYDDHGARAPGSAEVDTAEGFSPPSGTYAYPTDERYANNAADLVELRVRPLEDATAFRVTLNTLIDPAATAFTIAIGESDAPRPFPHGANARAPAELFLTVHGTVADLRDAASGQPVGPAPAVTLDEERRQIEVRVPRSAWDPGERTVRLAAGVGLWDEAAGRYAAPGDEAEAGQPGGARGLAEPTAFFNAAFRYDEPLPFDLADPNPLFFFGRTTSESAAGAQDAGWQRDKAQAAALADGDLSRFHADVDFAKLAAGTNDDMLGRPGGVPQSGPINRILASRFSFGQGVDAGEDCFTTEAARIERPCEGRFRGQLQPYSIYVPRKPAPSGGYGLTLLLHALSANYNQYLGSRHQMQFGERGGGNIVITPEARGPDGFYYDFAAADVFEVWADVARRYDLDPERTAISGYSMGGYGTYKLATRYPDLFARAQPTVGPPAVGLTFDPERVAATTMPGSSTFTQLRSLRHIPILVWNATFDELVPVAGVLAQVQQLDELGYRYTFDLFNAAAHLSLATNDNYAPAAEFLGDARAVRDPAHVSYVVNPTMDAEQAGLVGDHAYWLSDLRVRDPDAPNPRGRIDVRSEGTGERDPAPRPTTVTQDTLGGNHLAEPFTRRSKRWGPDVRGPKRDRLVIEARNIRSVTIDPRRAGVTCDAELRIKSDEPLDVRLAGCPPDLQLTRRCAPGGRLRVALSGDLAAVRDVNFKLGKRLAARDTRRPFTRAISARALSRTSAERLRAVVYLRGGDPARVILRRSLPRCGR